MKKILLESATIVLIGAVLSLVANAVSPRGLKLSRDYFPKSEPVSSAPSNAVPVNASANVAERLSALGFSMMDSNAVIQAYQSPERLQNLLIFVDARDDAHYAKGHIPGAYQLDYYRPENYLPAVLPAAMAAQRVVIYCSGGDCQDSELAGGLLRDSGVPPQNLFIYPGGFAEWSTNNLPVELGAKDSQIFQR